MITRRLFPVIFGFLILRFFSGCSSRAKAKIALELVPPATPALETTIRAFLAKEDPSAELAKQANTSLYELRVYDRDPVLADKRAQQLAVAIRDKFKYGSLGPNQVRIWEIAKPFAPIK